MFAAAVNFLFTECLISLVTYLLRAGKGLGAIQLVTEMVLQSYNCKSGKLIVFLNLSAEDVASINNELQTLIDSLSVNESAVAPNTVAGNALVSGIS